MWPDDVIAVMSTAGVSRARAHKLSGTADVTEVITLVQYTYASNY